MNQINTRTKFLLFIPAIYSLIYLLSLGNISYFLINRYVPLLLIIVPLSLLILKRYFPFYRSYLNRLAVLSPCFLAPFAVLYSWVFTPGGLTGGYGGYEFFIGWLTKYPNLGSINYEVLLGMICIIGSSFVPVIFAYFNLKFVQSKKALLIGLLITNLVLFIPVFIELDIGLWITGFFGAFTIGANMTPQGIEVFYSPTLRSIPLIIMIIITVKSLFIEGVNNDI